MKYKIGVIISCYNEEKNIPKIYEKLIDSIKTSEKIKDYIIYFIEDNSKDKTKTNIKKIIKNDKKVKLISFSKRMGKSIGLQVGFNNIDKIGEIDKMNPILFSISPMLFKYKAKKG